MSIIKNINRPGNFSSSENHKLLTKDKSGKNFGAPAFTYITEKNFERYLGESIGTEINAKPTSWGQLMEKRVHDILSLEYTFTSNITTVHPTIPYWVGSVDGLREIAERTVFDFKSPFTKKSFIQLVLPMYLGLEGIEIMYAIRDGFNHNGFEYPPHPDGKKFFTQLVSNGCIHNCEYAELIVYMPYHSELIDIMNGIHDGWLNHMSADEIPSLPDGGFFKNLNIIRWKIPQADKDLLNECVLKAGTLLITTQG